MGGLDAARWLEALVPLWVRAMLQMQTVGHAFKAVGPATPMPLPRWE